MIQPDIISASCEAAFYSFVDVVSELLPSRPSVFSRAFLKRNRSCLRLSALWFFFPHGQYQSAKSANSSGESFSKPSPRDSAKFLTMMVARDEVEPPTPAFSVCDYPARST